MRKTNLIRITSVAGPVLHVGVHPARRCGAAHAGHGQTDRPVQQLQDQNVPLGVHTGAYFNFAFY